MQWGAAAVPPPVTFRNNDNKIARCRLNWHWDWDWVDRKTNELLEIETGRGLTANVS